MKQNFAAAMLACACVAPSWAQQLTVFDDFSGENNTGDFNTRDIIWSTMNGNGYIVDEGILVTSWALELYGTMQFEMRRPSAIFPQTRVRFRAREFVSTGATIVTFIGTTGNLAVPVVMNGGYVEIDSFPATLVIGDIIRVDLFSSSFAHFDDVRIDADCQSNGATTDVDGDEFITGLDFDQFVAYFEVGDARADFDRDGFVTGIDFDCYVWAFVIGCP